MWEIKNDATKLACLPQEQNAQENYFHQENYGLILDPKINQNSLHAFFVQNYLLPKIIDEKKDFIKRIYPEKCRMGSSND